MNLRQDFFFLFFLFSFILHFDLSLYFAESKKKWKFLFEKFCESDLYFPTFSESIFFRFITFGMLCLIYFTKVLKSHRSWINGFEPYYEAKVVLNCDSLYFFFLFRVYFLVASDFYSFYERVLNSYSLFIWIFFRHYMILKLERQMNWLSALVRY